MDIGVLLVLKIEAWIEELENKFNVWRYRKIVKN
jgi:hypothetical protein